MDDILFHIDEECYILYLGKKEHEPAPYLRIGASARIPAQAHPYISSIIVTPYLTGNMVQERQLFLNGDTHKSRYVSLPHILATLRRYFSSENLSTSEFHTGAPGEDEHGGLALFYQDFNVAVDIDNTKAFNLHSRSARDTTYLKRVSSLAAIANENPLRHRKSALAGIGFGMAEKEFFLFHDGNIKMVDPSPEYYRNLAQHGYNGDDIDGVIGTKFDHAICRTMEWAYDRKKELNIYNSSHETSHAFAELLNSTERMESHITVTPLQDIAIGDCTHSLRGTTNILKVDTDCHFCINTKAKKFWRAKASDIKGKKAHIDVPSSNTHAMIPAVPYILQADGSEFPKSAEIADLYVQKLYDQLQYGMGSKEGAILAQLGEVVQNLSVQGVLDKKKVDGIASLSRGFSKKDFSDFSQCIFMNVITLLDNLQKEQGSQDEIKKLSAMIKKYMRKITRALTGIKAHVYIMDGRLDVLFFADTGLSARSSEYAKNFAARIEEMWYKVDSRFHDKEAKRLLNHMYALKLLERPRRTRTQKPAQKADQKKKDGDGASSDTQEAPPSAAAPAEAKSQAYVPPHLQKQVTAGALSTKTGRGKASSGGRAGGGGTKASISVPAKIVITAAAIIVALGILVGGAFLIAPRVSWVKNTLVTVGGAMGLEEMVEETIDTIDARVNLNGDSSDINREVSDAEDVDNSQQDGAAQGGSNDSAVDNPIVIEEPIETVRENAIVIREAAGGVEITLADIVRAANVIAVDNGYRELGADEIFGPNPDWIFPDNELKLPDNRMHTIVIGDTIWRLTADYVAQRVEVVYSDFKEVVVEYNSGKISTEIFADSLRDLQQGNFSENFEALVDRTIMEVIDN